MFSLHRFFLLALCVSATLSTATQESSRSRIARSKSRLDIRQDQQLLTEPVSFQTVTTTETPAGTITETCDVTLTPIEGENGEDLVRQDKSCSFVVTPIGGTPPPPPPDNTDDDNGGTTTTETFATETSTETTDSSTDFSTTTAGTATGTGVPAISEIGVGTIPASGTTTATDATATDDATATGTPPPAISVIGTGAILASNVAPSPVTVITTLSDGSVSTSVSTPSAAAAEEAQQQVPGRKLEVLPIGLGVFAGISVIALIVVGLVTYERTKYRKAFRQRKLAENGANMGYGGMAERA